MHILIEKYSSFVYRKWGEGLVVLASDIFKITLPVFRHHFVSSELIIQKQLLTTPFCHHGNLTWQPDRVYIPMCPSHKHMFTGNMQRYWHCLQEHYNVHRLWNGFPTKCRIVWWEYFHFYKTYSTAQCHFWFFIGWVGVAVSKDGLIGSVLLMRPCFPICVKSIHTSIPGWGHLYWLINGTRVISILCSSPFLTLYTLILSLYLCFITGFRLIFWFCYLTITAITVCCYLVAVTQHMKSKRKYLRIPYRRGGGGILTTFVLFGSGGR